MQVFVFAYSGRKKTMINLLWELLDIRANYWQKAGFLSYLKAKAKKEK